MSSRLQYPLLGTKLIARSAGWRASPLFMVSTHFVLQKLEGFDKSQTRSTGLLREGRPASTEIAYEYHGDVFLGLFFFWKRYHGKIIEDIERCNICRMCLRLSWSRNTWKRYLGLQISFQMSARYFLRCFNPKRHKDVDISRHHGEISHKDINNLINKRGGGLFALPFSQSTLFPFITCTQRQTG